MNIFSVDSGIYRWSLRTIVALSMLYLVVNSADAIPLRSAGRHADDVLPLIPILFGMFGKLAGLAATVASGLWARSKDESKAGKSALVAAIGGIWCAVVWFGWPMSRHVVEGGYFSPDVEASEFSLFRLIGVGVFAVLGVVVWATIAFSGRSAENGK